MTVNVGVLDAEVSVSLSYWSAKISDWQASNALNTFASVLESIVTDRLETFEQLNLFSEGDKIQVQKWNNMNSDLEASALQTSEALLVHEFIIQEALARPSAPAIYAHDGDFTYAELDSLSTKLAHHLVQLGITPESFVPLCFEKSAWTVISMLAVLKAGGAFLLLNPAHSVARLLESIQGVKASIILASESLSDLCRDLVKTVVTVSRDCLAELSGSLRRHPASGVTGRNPAYVIFTSGTTGKPKAIIVEHASYCASAAAHGPRLLIGRDTRSLQFASYSFDACLIEILTTLMAGGCVCIPDEDTRINDVVRFIQSAAVSWTLLTPSFIDTLNPDSVPSLRVLVLGGEKMTQRQLLRWADKVKLFNAYGPSECAVIATTSGVIDSSMVAANIGSRVGGYCWVVHSDNHDQLMPVGCVGELLVEGQLLARGYLNDVEKTTAAFIENPSWATLASSNQRRRMYKTGDLVRYNADGTFDYYGRKDSQVKIRGQRLELGEVEYHVKQSLPELSQVFADVVVKGDQNEEKTLAAFFCFSQAERNDTLVLTMTKELQHKLKALESSLSASLPSYMVPKIYVPLGHIPINISGKADRSVLNAIIPQLTTEELLAFSLVDVEKTQPRTDSEFRLRTLWAQVLKVEESGIGLDDNFFRLGGDSLGAIQLVAAAREQGFLLTVSNIFALPTLVDMVASLTTHQSQDTPIPAFSQLHHPTRDMQQEEYIAEIAALCHVDTSSIQDIYACTALQEGLMALSNIQVGSYISQMAYRLPAELDIERFKAAWQSAVGSIDILRTRIVNAEARSLQVVIKQDQITWLKANSLADYLQRQSEFTVGYGLPLTQYGVVEESDARYFIWTAHHAVYDGWSVPFIFERVEEAYTGVGMSKPLLSYANFINYLGKVEKEDSDDFWASQLQGAITSNFPPLPPACSSRVDKKVTHSIPLARKSGLGITTSTIVRAAWAMIIAKYNDSLEATFGATLTGRNAPVAGIDHIIGPTITTVPIRICIDNRQSVSEFLESIQDQSTSMIPFEHAGLQHIKTLSSEANDACNFNNLLVVQPADGEGAEDKLGLEQVHGGADGFYNYSLVIECKLGKETIDVIAEFDEHAVPSLQMERILRQFDYVIQQISLNAADLQVGDIDVLSPSDLLEISSFNKAIPERVSQCVHDMFSAKALRQPTAEAVRSWDRNFTYKELDLLSTRLAHHLVDLGVGAEVPVPVCFEKSAWTIVAMLAVLKAGGAFVPIDPKHPVSRRLEIMSQLSSEILLVSPSTRLLWSSPPKFTVELSEELLEKMEAPTTRPNTTVTPDNIMYIIFTSGSTGRPKGVMLEHSAVATSISGIGAAMGFDANTRALQFSAYNFDVSIAEIFATLGHGGCICVPSDKQRLEGLDEAISRMKCNWAFFTPSFASLLQPSQLASLTTIVLGGEAMLRDNITTWADRAQLINGYGPTEACVFCVTRVVGSTSREHTIGRAISSVSWVVDINDHNQLAPFGCVGELLIEGHILARGYLNDLETTESSFIQNPTWAEKTGKTRRMYKTGDLVRYNVDGTLDYLGRKDNQVKVRGQRMELGEVEHCLFADSSVNSAIVTLPKRGYCAQKLVAIITLARESDTEDQLELIDDLKDKNTALLLDQIRERAASQLPSYMHPTLWLVVKSIPLTTSGKLDRAQISHWIDTLNQESYDQCLNLMSTDVSAKFPTNSMDRRFQSLISRILNLPEDSLNLGRSFIRLGGDSITAMQIVSRARAQGIVISVQQVLQAQSIFELSSQAKLSVVSSISQDDPTEIDFDLSPIQQMYFQLSAQQPNQFNQSFLLRLRRRVDVNKIDQAVRTLVRQHSMLRARFQQNDLGAWAQKIQSEVDGAYHFNVHDNITEEELSRVVAATQQSLDIVHGPVFAANLFDMQDGRQLLFVVAHHLVIDLVSWRVILHDLEEIVQTGSLSSDVPLPFQSWIKLQANHATQLQPSVVLPFEVRSADTKYWGMTEIENSYGETISYNTSLDPETTSLILGKCQAPLRTEPVELLMACLLHAFSLTFTSRDLPTIYSEGHGRQPWSPEIDISDTVGWFTTISPLSISGQSLGNNNMIDTLKRTKDTRRSLPESGWPYFAARFLNQDGIRAFEDHMPMEVLFNYLGQYQQLEREDGLFTHASIDLGSEASDVSPKVPRLALFEISVAVVHEAAHLTITYNKHMSRQAEIVEWGNTWKQTLLDATRLLSNKSSEWTLSDFPRMSLTYRGLQELQDHHLTQIGLSIDNIEDIYPCSPLQQGVLLSQVQEASNYEVVFVYEVTSPTNQPIEGARLISSWQKVVDRHPILRTIFIDSVRDDGVSDQIVVRKMTAKTKNVSCHDDDTILNTLESESCTRHAAFEPRHQLTVCTTYTGRVFMRLDVSHAIIDASSVAIVLGDLAAAYGGTLPNGSGALYSSYIDYTRNVSHQESLDYWKSYLGEVSPCYFPTRNNTSDVANTLDAYRSSIDLSAADLQRYCSNNGVTIANLIQAAWALVLRVYTHSDDVCFGYIASGRDIDLADINEVVGPMINMLVCYIKVSQIRDIDSLVLHVKNDYLNALQNQHCSLAQIQHMLGLAGQPLFNTVLSVQTSSSAGEVKEGSLLFTGMGGHDPTEYDITVNLATSDSAIELSFNYWTGKTSEWQIQNVSSTFSTALKAIVSTDVANIEDIDLFSVANTTAIQQWNSIEHETVDACIHDIILEQVSAQPAAMAVCAWDCDLTYDELDKKSSQLANHLITLGVGPESFVPLCFEKSAWAIVSLLAVLRAGGAFVLLNPAHPVSRLSEIVQDLNAKVVLCSTTLTGLCTGLIECLFVVEPESIEDLGSTTEATIRANSNNSAYAIFTSGTTGKPKGTIIQHAAYASSAKAHSHRLLINKNTRSLQFASFSFDACLVEILTTLMFGGCVCVPSEETRVNDIVSFINDNNVTWALLTPSFISTIDPQSVPGLEVLVLGGEAMSQRHISTWAGRVSLVNAYGPSETAVIATTSGVLNESMTATNIGTSVGACSWIVDSTNHDRLVPIGSIGELLIEGPILSRGYLNDPTKTAAAFINNPKWARKFYSQKQSRRMYKTGDLVRYNENGSLDYLGRKDNQVKIHGQRLELGEIEYHLMADEEVDTAVVVRPKKGPAKDLLVAIIALRKTLRIAPSSPYPSSSGSSTAEAESIEHPSMTSSLELVSDVLSTRATSVITHQTPAKLVLEQDAEVTQSQKIRLKEWLTERLPTYMIPTCWIIVDSIPLSLAGKLDRAMVEKSVADMDESLYQTFKSSESDFEESGPTTVMDRKLQAVLSGVLNLPVKAIHLNRSFQGLGGDSITAMQVVSRARAEGVSIRVQDILGSRSISALALAAKPVGAAIKREDKVDSPFGLTPIQHMYFQLSGQKWNRFNQSLFLRFTQNVDSRLVGGAIVALVKQHSMLRARFQKNDTGAWTQFISKQIDDSYRFTSYPVQSAEERKASMELSQASIDIEKGPVFAVDMFDVEGEGSLIFLAAHHLVIDLVSWRVILHDIEQIIQFGQLSTDVPFPFQAWANLQAEHASQHLVSSEVLPVHLYPVDDPNYWGMAGKENVYEDVSSHGFEIASSTTSLLLGSCNDPMRTEPVEIFMATLLQSFGSTFKDRQTPIISSEGHGRQAWTTDIDLSDTVGWFTTMTPLQIDLKGDGDIVDVLRKTKDNRRKLAGNIWQHVASRFLSEEATETFNEQLPLELLFNYLGRYQQLEREDALLKQEVAPAEMLASDVGIRVPRMALFDVSVVVISGSLRCTIVYNRNTQRQPDILRWVQAWEQSILSAASKLISLSMEPTLSDFPLLPLTYDALETLKNEQLPQIGLTSFSEVEDIYPCSPMQQGLLLSQVRGDGSYEVDFTYEVFSTDSSKTVEISQLVASWQQVVDRHAMLRTIFVESLCTEGFSDQLVLKEFPANIQQWSSDENDEDSVIKLFKSEPGLNHKVSTPRHRVTICVTHSRRLFVRLEINHAIIDAASVSVLLQDWVLAYEGALQPGSGPSYSSYVKYLQDRPLEVSMKYWKSYLEDIKPCYFPKTDHSQNDKTRELRSIKETIHFDDNAFIQFCANNGVTAANVVQTIWGLVLGAYTHSEEICFGYLSSGRDLPIEGVSQIVGPLISMLVCRMQFSDELSIIELIHQVQQDCLAALEHRHCSLAQIQHGVDLPDQSLFNTILSVQQAMSGSAQAAPPLKFSGVGGHDPTEVSKHKIDILSR